jgi:hypothetical protein
MEIKGRNSILHKLVYEVRYHRGYLFLDRCGVTANRIMSDHPEWIIRNQDLNPQNAPLVSLNNGTTFSFNALKYDFALEQSTAGDALSETDVRDFVTQATAVSAILHEELELREFSRVGFRVWYLFGGQSQEDCEQWIQDLGGFKVDNSVLSAFGGKLLSQNHVAVIESKDRNIRMSINGVESQQQFDLGSEILNIQPHKLPKGQHELLLKQERVRQRISANPRYAAMIDVDVFVENPLDAIAFDFISESFKQAEEGLKRSFSKR